MDANFTQEFKWYHVREALLDWKSWVIALFFFCINIPHGALNTFSAQIVSGLGFGTLTTVLLGMPTGVIQAISSIVFALPPKWMKDVRCLCAGVCCLVPLICSIVIRKLPESHVAGRLAAYYFFYFFWGPYAVILSLPMANTSGHTKKITLNAMVFVGYCVANIVAPQTFQSSEAPGYATGFNCILGFEATAVSLMAIYFIGIKWENRRRDLAQVPDQQVEDEQTADLTDWEKPGFRYVC